MKPNPLVLSNRFTLPVAMFSLVADNRPPRGDQIPLSRPVPEKRRGTRAARTPFTRFLTAARARRRGEPRLDDRASNGHKKAMVDDLLRNPLSKRFTDAL